MNQAAQAQIAEQPTTFLVVISVTNIETGQVVPVSRVECPDRLRASTLLSEIRELGDSLMDILPGLDAEGFELSGPAPVPLVRSFAQSIEESTLSEDVKAYWRREIAQGDFLDPA